MASPSSRAQYLADGLHAAGARLGMVIEPIDDVRWRRVPAPGTWSAGREAEHAVEALAYHLWIVRRSIGDPVSSRRPVLERARLIPERSAGDVAALVRERVAGAVRLLGTLTDAQLALPTKPPRSGTPTLERTIQGMLIEHLDAHRASIETKVQGGGAPRTEAP